MTAHAFVRSGQNADTGLCAWSRGGQYCERPASDPVHVSLAEHAALVAALTGPTSGDTARRLAPGTLANLHAAGFRIVRTEPMT